MPRLLTPAGLRKALHVPFGGGRRGTKVYGRIGPLEVRLAASRADVRKAQRLRYDVFYNEMSATPSAIARARGRDKDPYDAICDHLLVYDTGSTDPAAPENGNAAVGQVVGTYRVLRHDMLRAAQLLHPGRV